MKDEKVMEREPVKVVATEAAQYMKPGAEYTLHRVAADKLIAKGVAQLVK